MIDFVREAIRHVQYISFLSITWLFSWWLHPVVQHALRLAGDNAIQCYRRVSYTALALPLPSPGFAAAHGISFRSGEQPIRTPILLVELETVVDHSFKQSYHLRYIAQRE